MRTFTNLKKSINLNIHEITTECPKINTFGHIKSYQYPKTANLKRNLRERPCPAYPDPRTVIRMAGEGRQDRHLQKRWDQVDCDHPNRAVPTTAAMGNLNRAPQPAHVGIGGVVKFQ